MGFSIKTKINKQVIEEKLEKLEKLPLIDPYKHLFYIDTGGREFGCMIANSLNINATALDIRYPFSRLLAKTPFLLRPLLWIFKEIVYRATIPSTKEGCKQILCESPVILVDDSASSGKTLEMAIDKLKGYGLNRSDITVVVLRCGKSARHLVDII